MKFTTFNLREESLKTLKRLKFNDLSPIQEQTLTKSLRGESIIAKAPTGSGKTHSFLLPLLNRLNSGNLTTQAIIIVPTIELGRQTVEFLKDFIIDRPDITFKFMEDFDFQTKIKSNIIITTPSKIKRLKSETGLVDFSDIKTIVLDEADMLSGPEFFADIDYVVSMIKGSIQFLVFSATYDSNLMNSLKRYVGQVNVISISDKKANPGVSFFAVDLRHRDLSEALVGFIQAVKPYLLLIFAKTTAAVEEVAKILTDNRLDIVVLHGKMSDKDRKLSFQRIKENKTSIIVCSDLMARGIDFSDVSDVLSIDVPKERAFFFHRVGRTGRFDKTGNAYLFFNTENLNEVKELEKLGATFKYVSLNNGELKEKRESPAFLKNKAENEELKVEIKKAVNKVRRTETKPNYKKKAKVAREKAIKKFNQKKLKEKIKKEKYRKVKDNG